MWCLFFPGHVVIELSTSNSESVSTNKKDHDPVVAVTVLFVQPCFLLFLLCPFFLLRTLFNYFFIIFFYYFSRFLIDSYQIKWDMLQRIGVMSWAGLSMCSECVCLWGCTCPSVYLYVSMHTVDVHVLLWVYFCVPVCSYCVCVHARARNVLVLLLRVMEMSFYQHFLTERLSEYWCMLAALHWGALMVCIQRAGKWLWRLISAGAGRLCVLLMKQHGWAVIRLVKCVLLHLQRRFSAC